MYSAHRKSVDAPGPVYSLICNQITSPVINVELRILSKINFSYCFLASSTHWEQSLPISYYMYSRASHKNTISETDHFARVDPWAKYAPDPDIVSE